MHLQPRTLTIVTFLLLCSVRAASLALPSDAASIRRQPIGRITQLDRSKIDRESDSTFYSKPNLVTHTDGKFIAKLTKLYDETLPDNSVILDIMSSHVSHLPKTKALARVDVHGMNLEELTANEARAKTGGSAFIRNLNDNPSFVGICEANEYDAALCCVGVQYLEEPEAVFAEVARILKPGGVAVVSFTNRFFYQKAMSGWIERGMGARARLVVDYFRAAGGFEDVKVVGDGTGAVSQLLSVGGVGGDPFVAVVATREKT